MLFLYQILNYDQSSLIFFKCIVIQLSTVEVLLLHIIGKRLKDMISELKRKYIVLHYMLFEKTTQVVSGNVVKMKTTVSQRNIR
jgi:hypothetical protein